MEPMMHDGGLWCHKTNIMCVLNTIKRGSLHNNHGFIGFIPSTEYSVLLYCVYATLLQCIFNANTQYVLGQIVLSK